MGSLGFDSEEIPRSNSDPLACVGHPFTDALATSETPVSGTVSGTIFTRLFDFTETSDTDRDRVVAIPTITGVVILRAIDSLPVQGDRDEVSVDKLWIRAVP